MQDKILYLKKVFGKAKLQNNGIDLMVSCPNPVCESSKNKLKLNIRLDNDLYHCWVCNIKGRNLGRLIKMKRPDMVSGYFDRFSNSFSMIGLKELQQTIDPVDVPDGFRLVMSNLYDPAAKRIRNYAHSRGITDPMLWRYRIGFSNEWRFNNRLLFPSFNEIGNINYWVSRSVDSNNPYRYINAKAAKETIIFNEIDLDWTVNSIFLVEGPLDLIKCGAYNSTCLLGSSLTDECILFQKIVRNSMDVTLALDPDAWKKQLTIAELFSSFDINVYLASPVSGDIGEKSGSEIKQLIADRLKYKVEFGSLEYLIQKI